MKSLATILLTFGVHILAYSQPTVPIDRNRESYREQYSVLASDRLIKHGGYVKFWKSTLGGLALESTGAYSMDKKEGYWEHYYGSSEDRFPGKENNIREKGFFRNGVRDSVWVFFYPEYVRLDLQEVEEADGSRYVQVQNANPVVSKSGFYRMGLPAKEWKYYDRAGQHIQTYDYDLKKLVYSHGCDLKNCESDFLTREPERQISEVFEMNDLMNSIHNYQSLKTSDLTFEFTIDEKGQILDIVQKEGTITNKKLIARAITAIESLSSIAQPKVVNGERVRSKRTVKMSMEVGRDVSVHQYQGDASVTKRQKVEISFKVN